MRMDASIFKAYDIRGSVPRSINADVARRLGLAFGQRVRAAGEDAVAVGRDGRLSSPELAAALARGLAAAGVDVIDIGLATTPMLYFATHTLCRSGVQVTGSHNPPADNGFKMVLARQAIHGGQIRALGAAMAGQGAAGGQHAAGHVRRHDVFPAYLQRIRQDIALARPMKIVLDCGNGVAGASAPAVFRAIGCEVVELFSEVDGHFPNHHPDPGNPENLHALRQALRETGAELGLALDGDGDRLGVVTRDGQTIFPDRQLILLARDVLQRCPGQPIVFDVKCTQQLAPAITAAGGQPMMHKTGHSLIKARMREVGAPLGGEMSGHLFFGERWYGFDDGTYAGCRLLELLSRHADAGAVLHALPASFSTPELTIACADGQAHRVAAALQDAAPQAFAPPAQVSTLDGVRVDWPDGFGLIRASNTTPVLVLRFEGQSQAALARIRQDMLALLRRVQPGASLEARAA
ncbi:MAG: phosphomannomutase/phosphoglucomutase [Ottowia sp.]|nr:phosphomannomutase/phosphoglucomutase [Ottowia sp.]